MSRFGTSATSMTTDTNTGLTWTRGYAADGEVTHDDAQAAVVALNEAKFGGFDDWRLPTVHELFGLVDHSRYAPAIDTEAFQSGKYDWVWTSTVVASSSFCVWGVDFGGGGVDLLHRGLSGAFVRAVRGGASPAGQ